MSFLAELKRRKIFRIAAGYLAVAIPIIAFVDLTYDTLPLGESAQETVKNIVTYALAVGFPIALVLSWLFDWTPEGIVRDTGVGDSASLPAGSKIDERAAAPTLRDLISSGPCRYRGCYGSRFESRRRWTRITAPAGFTAI